MEKFVIDTLKNWDESYYNGKEDHPNDAKYDKLKDWAKNRYPNNSYFSEIGSIPQKDKINLPYILGSLEKYNVTTINKWISKYNDDIVISQKLDGSSIYVEYINGKVHFASTRGDGKIGRNVTNKINLPNIEKMDKICLRGEVIIEGDSYKELGYKNRRNAVSGILNRDDNYGIEYLKVIFHELIKPEIETEINRLEYINKLGLNIVKYTVIPSNNITNELLINTNSLFKSIDYDSDGLVLANNNSNRENVKKPKNKICFKINDEGLLANVIEVEWNVGRSGKITPIVIIDPIEISGVMVSKANGFNFSFIKDNKIGPGSLIRIVRSGEVIPYIIGIEVYSDTVNIPKTCPSCNHNISNNTLIDLWCNNDECPSKILKKIEYYLITLGCENISIKTLEKLNVECIEDLYDLDELEITEMPGFGIKRGFQIVSEIQKTLNTTKEKFLAALGIPGVGIELSKSIVNYFDDLPFENFFTSPEEISFDQVEGIGLITKNKLINNLKKHNDLYNFLVNRGLFFTKSFKKDKIKGKIFALTGAHPSLKRHDLAIMIDNAGGEVKNISKKVDYLVTNDLNSKHNKMKKAKEYGINIITYNELDEMLK